MEYLRRKEIKFGDSFIELREPIGLDEIARTGFLAMLLDVHEWLNERLGLEMYAENSQEILLARWYFTRAIAQQTKNEQNTYDMIPSTNATVEEVRECFYRCFVPKENANFYNRLRDALNELAAVQPDEDLAPFTDNPSQNTK